VDHHGVGPDLRPVADLDRPEQLRAGPDHHLVPDRRVALPARKAGAAQRHALIHGHVIAHVGGLADHHSRAVVDEEAAADARRRVDLDAGHHLGHVGQKARCQRDPGLVHGVRDPVREERLHAAVGEEHLGPSHAAGGRVALLGGGEVLAQLAGHPGKGPHADHGAKKGVLM
jgi:hypothetical protein